MNAEQQHLSKIRKLILLLALVGCSKPAPPTVAVEITYMPEWAWFGPLPCSYQTIAMVEGTAWTADEALGVFEELLEGESDHILEPTIWKERLKISPLRCDEVDIPSCEEREDLGPNGATYTYTHVEKWHFEGQAIRWIRELCGGWPDTLDNPPGSAPVEAVPAAPAADDGGGE